MSLGLPNISRILCAVLMANSQPACAEVYELIPGGTLQRNDHSADIFPANAEGGLAPLSRPRDFYGAVFERAGARFGLSPDLLRAVAWKESRLRPQAVSPAGAVGIMQLMPATAARLGVNPYDPEENIFGGAAYLRQQLDRFDGRIDLALAAYNAGPARVDREYAVPRISETQDYVAGVTDQLAHAALPGATFKSEGEHHE